MPRVLGIDPGTVSIDLCGLDDGRLCLDESLTTAEALGDPEAFVARLIAAGPFDLIAGPSGYGLPLIDARDVTEEDVRLAVLAAVGESGGIGGLGALLRALCSSPLPVVFTPGVVHLASVPEHRKVNRVDMGTADKVCAAALAIAQRAAHRRCPPADVSLLLLELGGAFTAALAVDSGRIVDGCGGTSGPLGVRAAGALDGEVAYLAGRVPKSMLFTGGAATIAGGQNLAELPSRTDAPARLAWEAYLEGAVKAVAALTCSVPHVTDVVVSGRWALLPAVREQLQQRLRRVVPGLSLHVLAGAARIAKQAAEGAALLADGLCGGTAAPLVEALAVRRASGTVLDHLYVIERDAARRRLGLS